MPATLLYETGGPPGEADPDALAFSPVGRTVPDPETSPEVVFQRKVGGTEKAELHGSGLADALECEGAPRLAVGIVADGPPPAASKMEGESTGGVIDWPNRRGLRLGERGQFC